MDSLIPLAGPWDIFKQRDVHDRTSSIELYYTVRLDLSSCKVFYKVAVAVLYVATSLLHAIGDQLPLDKVCSTIYIANWTRIQAALCIINLQPLNFRKPTSLLHSFQMLCKLSYIDALDCIYCKNGLVILATAWRLHKLMFLYYTGPVSWVILVLPLFLILDDNIFILPLQFLCNQVLVDVFTTREVETYQDAASPP